MKIVGFEANNGARLGIVEGDNVVDLQICQAIWAKSCAEATAISNLSRD
jgi:hypothetical protein